MKDGAPNRIVADWELFGETRNTALDTSLAEVYRSGSRDDSGAVCN